MKRTAANCPQCAKRGRTICGCGSTLSRSTPIAPVNRERRKREREKQGVYDPVRMQWMKRQACLLWSDPNHVCQPGTVEGHHTRTVGAGGTDDDMVPLCRKAHDEVHRKGRQTFEGLHGVDLEAAAAEYAARWRTADAA